MSQYIRQMCETMADNAAGILIRYGGNGHFDYSPWNANPEDMEAWLSMLHARVGAS